MNGSMNQSILHGMAHADHMPPSTAVLFMQKLSNMHVAFYLFTYCSVLLTEVKSGCKSREHMPSDTQTGGKTSMSSAIFLHGNSPWSSPWTVHTSRFYLQYSGT